MALLFMDGFDHYAAGDIIVKWPAGPSGQSTVSATTPFGTGQSLSLNASGNHLDRALGANYTTLIAGMAFNYTSGSGVQVTPWPLIVFCDTNAGGRQLGCGVTTNGAFCVFRGTTVIATSTQINYWSGWHYAEFKVTFNGTTGSYTLKIDGVTILTASGVNTISTANAYANFLYLGQNLTFSAASGFASGLLIDDFLIMDTSGIVNNDFLGERRIYVIQPTAAGTYAQFTQTGGTASQPWTAINEATPNGDTSYLSSSTLGQIETSTYADLPASVAAVTAVQFNQWVKKIDVGTRQLAMYQKNGASEAASSASANLSASYADVTYLLENSVLTSSAWTVSEINASEFGTKVAV